MSHSFKQGGLPASTTSAAEHNHEDISASIQSTLAHFVVQPILIPVDHASLKKLRVLIRADSISRLIQIQ